MTHVRWIIVLLACWQGSAAHSETHAVGFRLLETQDHSRIVTGGSESGDTHPRPIRTYLWYPASTSENAEPMNFGRYAELADDDIWPIEILGGLHDKLGYSQRPLARSLGPELFEELKRKPVAAFEEATPRDGPFPPLGGSLLNRILGYRILPKTVQIGGLPFLPATCLTG